jgi:hypothetical protein
LRAADAAGVSEVYGQTHGQAGSEEHVETGSTPAGGYWELTDDGQTWHYIEYDAQGNVVHEETGTHGQSLPG